MIFTIPQFIFAFYCGYSGQTVFDDYYIAMYNLVFTSLPLVARAILEQDVYYIQESKPVVEQELKELKGRGDSTL
jgi:magnesium-transporting ATPase (P-type)